MAAEPILQTEGLCAGYGAVEVLREVTFAARAGEITCLMGRNGAGKTTLMQAIMGVLPLHAGRVWLDGQVISGLKPHQVPGRGVAWVPQGRRLFASMTVAENLEVGGLLRGNKAAQRERILTLFPRLRERLGQAAGTLSGGEQQMLAIARALALEPKLLLLDEPTEGLQPSMIQLIQSACQALKAEGVAVVLVEQRVDAVLKLADRVGFLHAGRLVEMLDVTGLSATAPQFKTYVGV